MANEVGKNDFETIRKDLRNNFKIDIAERYGMKVKTNLGLLTLGIRAMKVLPQEAGKTELEKKYLIALKKCSPIFDQK